MSTLLGPLEIIGCMEEATVRQKAVDKLIELSKEEPEKFCRECLFQTIKKFAEWNNYTNKISSANLIPICYPYVTEEQKSELVEIFTALTKHDMPMVRRATASKID